MFCVLQYYLSFHYFPKITFRILVKKTDEPIRIKIMSPVTLCSRIPRNFGCSPGAEHSDSSFKLFTWEIERTVAATNHGSPIIEHTPSMTATMSKSRWYPHPFCKKKTNAMTARSYKMTSEIRRLAGIPNEQLETIKNYVTCSRK